MSEEPTLWELQRSLERIESRIDRDLVSREAYTERQRAIDAEFEDVDKWQDSHEESHTWLSRLVAGTAFTLLVTLIVVIVELVARGFIQGLIE